MKLVFQSGNQQTDLSRQTLLGIILTVFEPIDEYKGDIARTYFYMVTAYED